MMTGQGMMTEQGGDDRRKMTEHGDDDIMGMMTEQGDDKWKRG